MIRKNSRFTNLAGFTIGAALLAALAGCADTPTWGGWSTRPEFAQLQATRGIQPDWVYYPAYAVYYSSNYQQYVCLDVITPDYSEWITLPEPLAPVTVEMLQTSPSVRMDFQDAPAHHHATVARNYPKNWRPADTVVVSSSGY